MGLAKKWDWLRNMASDDDLMGEAELIEGLERKKFSGKKLVTIVGGLVVLIFVSMGVMMLLGGDGSEDGDAPGQDSALDDIVENRSIATPAEEDLPPEKQEMLFFELPEMLVNLNTGGSGISFLKIKIRLEVDRQSYYDQLEKKKPRIMDDFQVYLRELRPDDLTGSAGMFRLKEELLDRINQSVSPTRVKDVLFEEIMIQGG